MLSLQVTDSEYWRDLGKPRVIGLSTEVTAYRIISLWPRKSSRDACCQVKQRADAGLKGENRTSSSLNDIQEEQEVFTAQKKLLAHPIQESAPPILLLLFGEKIKYAENS